MIKKVIVMTHGKKKMIVDAIMIVVIIMIFITIGITLIVP